MTGGPTKPRARISCISRDDAGECTLEIGLKREIAGGCSRAFMRWRDAFERDRRRTSFFLPTSPSIALLRRSLFGHSSQRWADSDMQPEQSGAGSSLEYDNLLVAVWSGIQRTVQMRQQNIVLYL
jgi:hypothetical protein